MRRIPFRLVYVLALPFGYMQRDLADAYRACLRQEPKWLPLTALALPVVLVLWSFSRGVFTMSIRVLEALAV